MRLLSSKLILIDFFSSQGSNLADILSKSGCFRSDSDVDEQLLITIPFRNAVKLRGIVFETSEGKEDESSGPKEIRLFVDNQNLDFSDAEDAKSTQDLVLTEGDLLGKEVKLNFVKFQCVHNITLFIKYAHSFGPLSFSFPFVFYFFFSVSFFPPSPPPPPSIRCLFICFLFDMTHSQIESERHWLDVVE